MSSSFFQTFKLSFKKIVLPPQKQQKIKTVNVMQLHGGIYIVSKKPSLGRVKTIQLYYTSVIKSILNTPRCLQTN